MDSITSFLKYLATSNSINFLIMLMIFGWIIKKINLNKIFEQMKETVVNNITLSDKQKDDSNKKYKEAEELLKNLPEDVKILEKNCKEKISVFETQLEKKTQNSIDIINSNITKNLTIDEKILSNNITGLTAKESIKKAKVNLINLLKENNDLHNKFIQNSLDELEKVKL